MSNWKPGSTAPKDGRLILARCRLKFGFVYEVVRWDEEWERFVNQIGFIQSILDRGEWMEIAQ